MLTKNQILDRLHYDAATGRFINKTTWGAAPAGAVAGAINRKGYRQLSIGGQLYYAHRLVWFMEHGQFPIGVLDHINRIKDDNRISNLREVSHKQNMENTGLYAHNTSGYKGVIWDKQYGKWLARVTHNGKQVFAGRFDTVYDAHQAYERKVAQLFTCR